MARSNPQYQCSGCHHKNSRNQLKGSNGYCIHCKTRVSHNAWWGGSPTLANALSIPKEENEQLQTLSADLGLDMRDMIIAAIEAKLAYWLEDQEQIEKRVKQDLMLSKLYRR